MRRIVTVNQKGGTGKTSTAVNLAAALAEAGHSVLLVDLDYQGNATAHLGATAGERDLLSVLLREATIDEAAVPTTAASVELLAASDELSALERHLGGTPGAELRLRTALASARERDFVLFDCPPALGLLTACAMAAADEVLVPVAAGAMELEAVAKLQATVDEVGQALNPGLTIDHILICRLDDRRRLDQDVVAALRAAYPQETLQAVVHENVRIKEAYTRHEAITTYDPKGRAAQEFRDVAAELIGRKP